MRLVLGYLAVLWGQDNLAGSINEVSRYIYFNMCTLSHPPMSYWRVYGNRIAKTLMQADTSSSDILWLPSTHQLVPPLSG